MIARLFRERNAGRASLAGSIGSANNVASCSSQCERNSQEEGGYLAAVQSSSAGRPRSFVRCSAAGSCHGGLLRNGVSRGDYRCWKERGGGGEGRGPLQLLACYPPGRPVGTLRAWPAVQGRFRLGGGGGHGSTGRQHGGISHLKLVTKLVLPPCPACRLSGSELARPATRNAMKVIPCLLEERTSLISGSWQRLAWLVK